MNKVANRQVICEVLCEKAQMDQDIVVLCSDSRGSASLAPFAKAFPGQFVETGIAEQDLVGIAAGLARNGKRHLPPLRPAFCPRGAWNRRRWTWPTRIPM